MKKALKYIIIILVSLLIGSGVTFFILKKDSDISYIYDSVVYIESYSEYEISGGSGFVYKEKDGLNYIVTNYHIIDNYESIYVYNNEEQRVEATLLGYDEYTDIAILTIEDKFNLKSVKIGNSDKIKVCDEIYVVGAPLSDYVATVTHGIISYIDRKITIPTTHGNSSYDAIQVDAAVNHGNSGGALLNKKGYVIGMISVVEENSNGIGFAIPINYVMEIINKIENNELNRPSLGGSMANTTNEKLLAEKDILIDDIIGVVIIDIKEGYPLYNSNLTVGDIITKIGGNEVSDVSELQEELYNYNVGDSVDLEYYRDGSYYTVNVILNK